MHAATQKDSHDYIDLFKAKIESLPGVCLSTVDLRNQIKDLLDNVEASKRNLSLRLNATDMGRIIGNIDRYMFHITSNVKKIKKNKRDGGHLCAGLFTNTKDMNPGSLDDVLISMVHRFYDSKAFIVENTEKISKNLLNDPSILPFNWKYIPNYFTLAGLWLKYSSETMYQDDLNYLVLVMNY